MDDIRGEVAAALMLAFGAQPATPDAIDWNDDQQHSGVDGSHRRLWEHALLLD